jgi:hypothetical protein
VRAPHERECLSERDGFRDDLSTVINTVASCARPAVLCSFSDTAHSVALHRERSGWRDVLPWRFIQSPCGGLRYAEPTTSK